MKEYRKRIELGACRLERADLLKLAELMKETLPVSDMKEDFEVSTLLPNISIKESSIEDFLRHEELPDRLIDLSIEAVGRDAHAEPDKRVTLEFKPSGNTLHVRGADETWVLGKSAQIAGYLRGKSPWFGVLTNAFQFVGGFVLAVGIMSLSYFIQAREPLYSVTTTALLIAVVFAMALNYNHKFLAHTQIIVTSKKSVVNRESVILVVTILSLIVTIIGLVR
jgi:hypothetical protein